MMEKVLIYISALLTGLAVWIGIGLINIVHPFLSYDYPFLILFIGMTFPGGASIEFHFASHIAQTWLPFLAAFLVAYALTGRKARFSGAVAMYGVFVFWSLAMAILLTSGVALATVSNLGLAGTFLGGLGLYLWLVSPVRSA
jgi:hypothetical protein